MDKMVLFHLIITVIGFSFTGNAKVCYGTVPIAPQLLLLLAEETERDSCPADPLKTVPGVCGCGVTDTDSDADGVLDCLLKPGATNIRQFLVASDGSYSVGNPTLIFNDTRDQGSKIVYFNQESGDNTSADVYWWNGTNIVDSNGLTANPENSQVYGTDPLAPNEQAIKPFKELNAAGDSRLRTQSGHGGLDWRFGGLAGGYPDWFLFRRGQSHVNFDIFFSGGRSEAEPMVVAAYGPLGDGRAVIDPAESAVNPMIGIPRDGDEDGTPRGWFHQILYSLEFRTNYNMNGVHRAETFAEGGGPVTAFIEDCYWTVGGIVYPPQKTTFRRNIITNSYNPDGHNQGFYTSLFKNKVTFDEVIFYKNGYKTNPVTDPDPVRSIFDRNVYQGGGAKMGFTYRNVISADGGSGGPQMRLGGLMENSLVLEGYFFSSTQSNEEEKIRDENGDEICIYRNDWMQSEGQVGTSAIVRNNVQLIFGYPSDNDPDTYGLSDNRAQARGGYMLGGSAFGVLVEGNIISGAMVKNDLTNGRLGDEGLHFPFAKNLHTDDLLYAQKNNTIQNNIIYGVTNGFQVIGDAELVENVKITNNVFVSEKPSYSNTSNLNSTSQLLVDHNRFYSDNGLPADAWIGENNSLSSFDNATGSEGWSDPERTLKRYVTEVLGLTLLDWTDNPYLDPVERQVRIDANEEYDPAGIKTFMAVATNMRYGGADAIPSSGKPSMTGDYPWDERFTAILVVNWIREGFNLPGI